MPTVRSNIVDARSWGTADMKVKILSVRADENFGTILAGEEALGLSANEKLEQEIQTFLDQNPSIKIQHVQFSSLAIIPKTASWGTTNTDIEWEIEKSVLIIYDTQA